MIETVNKNTFSVALVMQPCHTCSLLQACRSSASLPLTAHGEQSPNVEMYDGHLQGIFFFYHEHEEVMFSFEIHSFLPRGIVISQRNFELVLPSTGHVW